MVGFFLQNLLLVSALVDVSAVNDQDSLHFLVTEARKEDESPADARSHGQRRSRFAGSDNTSVYVAGSDGTYAQNYQDVWAVALASHNGWNNGFYLDLGAYHGTECSNSALLDITKGWKGICVEPEPVGFETRNCALVSRPLSDTSDKPVKFFGHGSQIKHIGFRSWEDDPNDQGLVINTITVPEMFDCISGKASSSVDCSRIKGNVEIPDFIHFVSLDVEGQESNVLETFPWSKHKVGAWVVEQTDDRSRPSGAREKTRQILRNNGYMNAPVQNPGVDEYWVLPEFWADSLAQKAWRTHPAGSNGC